MEKLLERRGVVGYFCTLFHGFFIGYPYKSLFMEEEK
jgi:hypothetical protein